MLSKNKNKCDESSDEFKKFRSLNDNKNSEDNGCFYCEYQQRIFAPAIQNYKTSPTKSDKYTDTRIYEYYNVKLQAKCDAYFYLHCSQCVRLRNERIGRLCATDITIEDISRLSTVDTAYDVPHINKILKPRLRSHVSTYLSGAGKRIDILKTCHYCNQTTGSFDDVIFENNKLTFSDQQCGTIYSYCKRLCEGSCFREKKMYYAY